MDEGYLGCRNVDVCKWQSMILELNKVYLNPHMKSYLHMRDCNPYCCGTHAMKERSMVLSCSGSSMCTSLAYMHNYILIVSKCKY